MSAIKFAWTSTPPATPGSYWWRRSWQWEPVIREIPPDRRVFSFRFEQMVPVEKLGGEWGEAVNV